MASTIRILVKMKPQVALAASATSQTNLRPLYEIGAPAAAGLGKPMRSFQSPGKYFC